MFEVNNGRHYKCQSNVWAHMGIMRQRSIFEDNKFIRKDDLNTRIKTVK